MIDDYFKVTFTKINEDRNMFIVQLGEKKKMFEKNTDLEMRMRQECRTPSSETCLVSTL